MLLPPPPRIDDAVADIDDRGFEIIIFLLDLLLETPRRLFDLFNELDLELLLEAPSILVDFFIKNVVGFFINDLDDDDTNDLFIEGGLRLVDLLRKLNNDDVGGIIVFFFGPCLVKAEDDVPPANIFLSLLLLGEGASIVLN